MFDKNKYQKEYQSKRYYEVREKALDFLGGECVNCGSLEDLEFDHISPDDKEFEIDRLWATNKKDYLSELNKCQLLCKTCHIKKSVEERGQKLARGAHGTLSSYRYCKCDICKKAKSLYNREYKKRTRSKVANATNS